MRRSSSATSPAIATVLTSTNFSSWLWLCFQGQSLLEGSRLGRRRFVGWLDFSASGARTASTLRCSFGADQQASLGLVASALSFSDCRRRLLTQPQLSQAARCAAIKNGDRGVDFNRVAFFETDLS